MEPTTRKQLRKLSAVANRKRVTDTSGSPSETYRLSVLDGLVQHFNNFVHGLRRETTVDEFAYAVATERRVAAELYPPRRING